MFADCLSVVCEALHIPTVSHTDRHCCLTAEFGEEDVKKHSRAIKNTVRARDTQLCLIISVHECATTQHTHTHEREGCTTSLRHLRCSC